MNSDNRCKAAIKMYDNFIKEVKKAGGLIEYEQLDKMSALDLLIILSTNNIEIKYKKDNYNDNLLILLETVKEELSDLGITAIKLNNLIKGLKNASL